MSETETLAQDAIGAPFARMLQEHCAPQVVRTIERDGIGTASTALWQALQESGFIDALVAEQQGGAGLDLRSVYGILESCGRHALPLPLGETMIARALLAHTGHHVPSEPIALGCARREGNNVICGLTPYARTAHWALLQIDAGLVLLPCAQAQRNLLAAPAGTGELRWATALDTTRVMQTSASLLHAQACVVAAQIAGALGRVFDMTLRYANERVQFGKPIGKFQAVQHQISVMAEHSAMASMAARIGCDSDSYLPYAQRAAIAKAVTSEAASHVANLGHALHGAIGMTEEYDLQLFTRRLHEWRLCAGAESFWQQRIGADLLASSADALDFVRGCVGSRSN